VLVVREPPSTSHGRRAARLTVRLGAFIEREDLGAVFAQDTGFRIERDPDTVRAPDVAFVSRDRLGQIRAATEDLDGEDVLPGFRCPLHEIL
jgi:Uma2 family endonuclease